ncbi:uncharacterized protein LOC128230700 [Mya arenaria]|uniref:uncharacterized protein LOC128230700 n=1 Tax=Mya arenaria TaxID=6604 RepID=UPI0022E7BA13|nr:uncharacterized protein LOC128230700 [Mya arenaria]
MGKKGKACRNSDLLTDFDFLRIANYKDFLSERSSPENIGGARLVAELLQQELARDFKLSASNVGIQFVPRHEFPFTKHTVTTGIGNVTIDYEDAREQHTQIKERQRQFAKEIEKAKIEMENIRLVEQVWFDDYVNGKYVNDLTLNRPFANNDITPSDGDSIDEEVESKEVNENKNDLALMEAGTVSDAESRTNGYRVTNEVSHAADGSTCAEAESVHYFIQHKDVIYKLQQHKETMEGQSACLPNVNI